MILQRLVLTFERAWIPSRALYRTTSGAGPGTKARAREAATLVRTGLREALEALEGRVDVIGTSGFETREDVIAIERKDVA